MIWKKGGTSIFGERSTTKSCMLHSRRINRSRKGINWFSPNWLDRRCDDLPHGWGLLFKSRMAQLRHGKNRRSIWLLHAFSCSTWLGDIVQLVELRSCNWVVVDTDWMSNCPCGNDSILYLNRNIIIDIHTIKSRCSQVFRYFSYTNWDRRYRCTP